MGKADEMFKRGEISASAAARILTRPGTFESKTKVKKSAGGMVPFDSKQTATGPGIKDAGRNEIDRANVPSNMSKGGKAGPNRAPAQAKASGINRGKNQRGAPASTKVKKRQQTLRNKGPIYPSGPLAGGPNGRP